MRWLIGALGLAVVAVVVVLLSSEETRSIKLARGGRIEILKVSAGTNHFYSEEKGWKGFVADVAPSDVLRRFGVNRKEVWRPRGSLALWIREFDQNGRPAPVTLKGAGAEFGDGRYVAGTLQRWSSNVVMIELPIYPRADAQIQIAMSDIRERLSLWVKNPAPTKRAKWSGSRRPGTNVVGNMLFSMWETSGSGLRFYAKATNGPPVGWMFWRCEVEDSVGNWDYCRMNSRGWELDPTKFERGPLKLTVFPEEYLSAGFVKEPAPGEALKLNVSARAAALGLNDVFVLGRGDYVVRNVEGVAHVERPEAESRGVRIVAAKPNAVVMYRAVPNVDRIETRVHERTDRNEGRRVFRSTPPRGEERSMAKGNVLRNFPVVWEYTTNQTEVEIVVRHRPVEFYVNFEKESQ